MQTALILLIFVGVPLALFAFVIGGAIHRARQQKKVYDAADKYLRT
jgi:hypothetical protein